MTTSSPLDMIADHWPLSPEQQAAQSLNAPLEAVLSIPADYDLATITAALHQLGADHDILNLTIGPVAGFRKARQYFSPPATCPVTLSLTPADQGRQHLHLKVPAPLTDHTGLLRLITALGRQVEGRGGAAEAPSYLRYVEWRTEESDSGETAAAARYWQDHLAGEPPAVPQLIDRGSQSAQRGSLRRAVPAGLAGHLSLSAFQAGWWALLGRLSGQEQLIVGWEHDCRADYDVFADTIGPLTKILPLKLTWAGDQSFADWLAALDRCLDQHRACQEGWPVEALPRHDHLRVGFGLIETAGASPWPVISTTIPTPFELVLRLELDSAGQPLAVVVDFDQGRYSPATIERLCGQYLALLALVCDNQGLTLDQLSPLAAGEAAQFARLDARATPPADPVEISARIAAYAAATPAAPALIGDGVDLNYRALDQLINHLAGQLQARGLGPEQVVALDCHRSPALVIALLAIWRAGGAYLPLDPTWPLERRRQLLDQVRPLLVLTDHQEASALAPWPVERLPADLGAPTPAPSPAIVTSEQTERAAYLLFTSGSTGQPKGVVVEQRQVMNYTAALCAALDLDRCQRFALTSTVAADLGNSTLFAAFHLGRCLVVASEADMADGAGFAAFLTRHAVDCLKIVPSHLAALLDTPAAVVPGTVILGGEAAPATLINQLVTLAPTARLFNHYGPTEATVGVLIHRHPAGQRLADGANLPLTEVLAGNAAWVLDRAGQPVPTGAVGMIHLAGRQLARGYLGTDQGGFKDDPTRPGERLYATGDLGRYRPEGGLQLIGRADAQVKIRGYRVEPGEVEAALHRLPAIGQAAVIAREGQLLAYVTATSGLTVEPAAILSALSEQLPSPLVPARLIVLDHLPRLANGKIDRRSLAGRPLEEPTRPQGQAPRDPLEQVLAADMAGLLDCPVDQIAIDDDFFALGGHSLLVIRLVARLRQTFGIEVAPGLVFDHPTVAGLAEALQALSPPAALITRAEARLALDHLSEADRAALLAEAATPALPA